MIFTRRLITTLLVLIASAAHADVNRCPSLDLSATEIRNEAGQWYQPYLQKREQGPSEMCFAFVTADLTSQALNEPVSEFYLALMTNQDRTVAQDQSEHRTERYGLTVGSEGTSLFDRLADEPVCTNDELSFDLYKNVDRHLVDQMQSLRENSNSAAVAYFQKIFPSLTTEQLTSIGALWTKQKTNKIMFLFAHRHCENRGALKMLPNRGFVVGGAGTASDGISTLHDALSLGHLARLDVHQKLYTPDNNQGGHAITLVGQESRSDGKCYYKMRDSDLTSCAEMPNAISNCDVKAGTYWVSERALSETLDSSIYLK